MKGTAGSASPRSISGGSKLWDGHKAPSTRGNGLELCRLDRSSNFCVERVVRYWRGGWSPLEVALGGDKLGRGHRLGWDPAENEIHHPSG